MGLYINREEEGINGVKASNKKLLYCLRGNVKKHSPLPQRGKFAAFNLPLSPVSLENCTYGGG